MILILLNLMEPQLTITLNINVLKLDVSFAKLNGTPVNYPS